MSKVVRSVKNVTKGYTTAQVKVRNATSNDAWGPVGSDMAEIAALTYDVTTFYEIMDIIDKRLNDKGRHWRHVLKSLKVLDYCLHEGSEHVVTWCRKNIYVIKTLREFQHVDDDGRDVGQNIRVSAKELTSLILDDERLRAERQDRRNWKSRVTGLDEYGPPNGESHPKPRRRERQNDDDDLEYKLAIEASKNEAEEDARRRAKARGDGEDDADLAKAIKLSKEEEELRRRELEDSNATSLFDDTPTPTQPTVAQPTGWNQGYQQQPPVDWFGNVIDPQQQQNTGFGLQGQPTGYQNGLGFGGGFQQQSQPTGYNPGFQSIQGTGFGSNGPFNQQPQTNGFGAFGQTQQRDNPQPGSHNPFATTQQPQGVNVQPTGSNNPFATGFQRPASAQPRLQPTLSTLQEQNPSTAFNPITNYQPQPQLQQEPPKLQDPHMARLNDLLGTQEGQDTFGNVGILRIPAQHTAPGTFVNSAGAGLGRITQNATGNPFLNSQFTGMPQTTGFGRGVAPAQTGPAGTFGNPQPFGAGSNNPFGSSTQGQHGQQSGSLIDF